MDPATSTADLPAQPDNIRACPFCGAPATLDHNQAHSGFFVSCTNEDCPFQPEPLRDYVTEERAVEVWNGVGV